MFGNSKKKWTAISVILSFAVMLASCGKAASSGDVNGEVTAEIITEEHRTVDTEGTFNLDDTKFVTLDKNSSVQIDREGKAIMLELTEGMLFFNVSQKLAPDESLQIIADGTSIDIHGTSGVICRNDKGRYSLYLTDGEIEIKARNPENGEEKTQKVKAPVKVSVYLYSDRPTGQTLEFVEVPLEPDMLPPFAANQIYSDVELMTKITDQTGWTVTDISKVHDEIVDGSYEPATSDAVQLGFAEPDDIAKKMGLVAEEPKKAESPAGPPVAGIEPEQPAESAKSADGRQIANAQTAPSAPNSLGVAYIREDGIWVLTDGTLFDPAFYAASDPEVVKAFGNDPNALLQHYLLFGRYENRPTYLSEEVRVQMELEAKNREVIAQLLWAQINAQNQTPAPASAPAPDPGPGNDPGPGYDPAPGNDPGPGNDPDPGQTPEITAVQSINVVNITDFISSVYYVESGNGNYRVYKAKRVGSNDPAAAPVSDLAVEMVEELLYYGSGIYFALNEAPLDEESLDEESENVTSAYTYVGFAEDVPVYVCETEDDYENPVGTFEESESGDDCYETELPGIDLTLVYHDSDECCELRDEEE